MDPKKLGELFEGTHFRWSEKHNSWDEMLAIVELNRNEFERLEAEDPERLKRIEYCLGHLLAAKLQSRAISEFGNASDESIRQLLLRDLSRYKSDLAAGRKMLDDKAVDLGMDDRGREMLQKYVIDPVPGLVANALTELVGQLRLIPEANAAHIAEVLYQMAKEEFDADSRRGPQG